MNECYCVNKLNQCYCFNRTSEYSSLNNLNRYSSFNKTVKNQNEFVNTNSITIFNHSELKDTLLFKSGIIYKYVKFDTYENLKNTCYGNFFELDNTKCKIDSLDKESEKLRRASAKYINEYELVKVICKKKVISRAYFKLYELIYFEDIVNLHVLDCFFICEAPGGFIECLTDIRRKRNLRTSYISISANSEIKYHSYLDSDNLLYGDITKIDVIDNTIKEVLSRFPTNLDFITADGGFDVKIFNSQEIISNKLILCEIYIALNTQKKNGMFIIKYFDMFTHNSVMSYLILCTFYKEVKIIKPKTSRNCNSERYLVCSSFVGINQSNTKIITDLREIIKKYVFVEQTNSINNQEIVPEVPGIPGIHGIPGIVPGIYTLIYPYFNFDLVPRLKNEIRDFNQTILEQQVKSINDSITMVNLKNIYFQNLLLNLFTDNNINLDSIFSYKSILYTRIIKCIDWLRIYKINTNQIVYRFN